MRAEEALARSAALHLAWTKRVADKVPAVAAQAKLGKTDYAEHHADRSATAEQQDGLNESLVALVTRYREGS